MVSTNNILGNTSELCTSYVEEQNLDLSQLEVALYSYWFKNSDRTGSKL